MQQAAKKKELTCRREGQVSSPQSKKELLEKQHQHQQKSSNIHHHLKFYLRKESIVKIRASCVDWASMIKPSYLQPRYRHHPATTHPPEQHFLPCSFLQAP